MRASLARPAGFAAIALALTLAAWPEAAGAQDGQRRAAIPAPPASPAPPIPPTPPPRGLAPRLARAAAPAPADLQWRRYPDLSEVALRDIAAVVRVMPEDRPDIAYAIVNNGPLAAPDLRRSGPRFIIEGGLRRKVGECSAGRGGAFSIEVAGRRINEAQLPVIYLRVPLDADIAASGGVSFWMTPSDSARVAMSACGEADIERVAGAAEITASGADMNLRLYDAGSAEVSVAGEGEVVLGVVRNGLTLSIAGGGDLRAAHVDGPMRIALQGAGDVNIDDGRVTAMSVAIVGSGDINFHGEAERLDAAIFGAGDVRVRRVSGEVNRRIFGAGEVIVGR